MKMAKKSCVLARIPTTLVFNCLDVLVLVINKMITLSPESGHFPSAWEEAMLLFLELPTCK